MFDFAELGVIEDETHHVADGYDADVLIRWGDPIIGGATGFDPATLEMRVSRNGNYLSVTATIRAESRPQLDALYRELTSHPLVSVVL